jgi:hypothetical protein
LYEKKEGEERENQEDRRGINSSFLPKLSQLKKRIYTG